MILFVLNLKTTNLTLDIWWGGCVGTGFSAFFINIAVENFAGWKFAATFFLMRYSYLLAFLIYAVSNGALVFSSVYIVTQFAPAAAGSGIPEIKGYLNGISFVEDDFKVFQNHFCSIIVTYVILSNVPRDLGLLGFFQGYVLVSLAFLHIQLPKPQSLLLCRNRYSRDSFISNISRKGTQA